MEGLLKALAEQLEKKQITPETYQKTVANLLQVPQKKVVDVNDDIPIERPVEKVKAVRGKAFKDITESYKIDMSSFKGADMRADFEKVKPIILKKLHKVTAGGDPMKAFLEYRAKFFKPVKNVMADDGYFKGSDPIILTKGSDKKEQLNELLENIESQVESFIKNGSDLRFDSSVVMYIQLAKWTPLKGGSYIPSPLWVRDKKCCVNVRNTDNQCFKWAILSALHPQKKNAERLNHYLEFESNYNWDGITFPASEKSYQQFEKNNEGISLNVYQITDKYSGTKPLYVREKELAIHIDLGLINDGEMNHFVWIPNFSRFRGRTSKDGHKKHYCKRCMHGFTKQRILEEHTPDCQKHFSTKIVMPKEGENEIRFKNIAAQLRSPFVVYADFECVIIDKKHVPCGYSFLLVSEYNHFELNSKFWKLKLRTYTGKDCMKHFFKDLDKLQFFTTEILKTYKLMNLTPKEEKAFQEADCCYLCKGNFEKGKHRDHDHITGAYRGAACPGCNLNFNLKAWKLPVIFHNLKGYDSHIILNAMKYLDDKGKKSVKCIPNNMEKYLEFEICKLKFIDSLQFMNSSLSQLVDNLAKEGTEKFNHTKAHWKDTKKVELVTRKGVYPYEYMDSFEKFEEISLPPIEAFFSSLTKTGIKPEEYEYAQKIWKAFNCKTMKDYHNLYLQTDVLLLADVFENFRNVCYDAYNLDPANFLTAPHLAWNAMLKYTKIELESLTDINMHLMVEKGIRGGICMPSKRYAKANNKYMKEYDPNLPISFITYLDANNLYGWAMIQPLPTGGYQWIKTDKWDSQRVLNYDEESKYGYILEVDLDYPSNLHDLHNDYPVAAESQCFTPSPFMQDLMEDLGTTQSGVMKLIPNLHNKEKYVVHVRTLKQYLELGLKLKKVHRIIRFDQSRWLKPYIDFNTERRKQAKNDFEKDFWKLMNNAVFGKFMENVRNRVQIELATTKEKAETFINKPTVKRWKEFNKHLLGIEMMKNETKLNKPIPVGLSILDISKTLMYDFHYNYIKKEYGNKAQLLYTDTDSLVYHITTEDMYEDFKKHQDKFDFSEYPLDHPNYNKTNAKVIGKMKDEVKGKIIKEFVGIRPKMYSVNIENDQFIKKAKGVKGPCMKDITHEDYKRCLFGNTTEDRIQHSNEFSYIKSVNHKLKTATGTKITLSCIEDKRYYINMIDSFAHGHHLADLHGLNEKAKIELQNSKQLINNL